MTLPVLYTTTPQETVSWGRCLAEAVCPGDVIVLCGQLGAGKTQLTKGIAAGLGVADEITSPTFNIVYEYHDGRIPLYHFDLYRLERASELDDIAYWELLEGDGVSVIEWGDRFPDCMASDYLELCFTVDDRGVRSITVCPVGRRAMALAGTLFDQLDPSEGDVR